MANEKVTRRSVIGAPTPPLAASPPSAGDVTNDGAGMSVVVIDDLTALEKYVPAWENLAAAALEPNVFYEPWMLMPAIRAFGAGQRVRFALILTPDTARSPGPPLLAGLFPLEQQSCYQGLSQKLPFKTIQYDSQPGDWHQIT